MLSRKGFDLLFLSYHVVAISKSPRGRVRPVCHSASRVRREEKQYADDTDADAECGSHCMSLNDLSQREERQSGEG